jgi:hypothetical protein
MPDWHVRVRRNELVQVAQLSAGLEGPLTSSMSALARLDALTEELAALRAELAAEKDRRSTSRRWVIGAVIAAAAATSAIVTAVTTIIVHVH